MLSIFFHLFCKDSVTQFLCTLTPCFGQRVDTLSLLAAGYVALSHIE